jgi:cytochrome P450
MSGKHSDSQLDLDLTSQAFLSNPWASLHALQDAARVFWSSNLKGWIITRHEDVTHALLDDGTRFSADRFLPWLRQLEGVTEARYPNSIKFARNFAFRDGKEHERVRRLFLKSFNGMSARAMRPVIQDITRDLIRYAETQQTVEFLGEIAVHLPTKLLAHIIGIPETSREDFRRWSVNIQLAANAAKFGIRELNILEEALAEITTVLIREIDRRRTHPQEDLLTFMVRTSEESNDRLSEEEMISSAQIMVVGAFDTTIHALTLGLRTLVERNNIVEYMLSHEDNVPPVIMEVLRFISPVRGQLRHAASSFEWHGKEIQRGDIVYLSYDAANHDPRAWKDPDAFDPHRNFGRNVIFGGGIHNCLGQNVAKMELSEFFPALFRHFSRIELLPTTDVYPPSFSVRGIGALPVRFTK